MPFLQKFVILKFCKIRKMNFAIIVALSALLAIPYSQASLRFFKKSKCNYINFTRLKLIYTQNKMWLNP